MTSLDDAIITFGDEDQVTQGKVRHPVVLIFHFAFRLLALMLYLIGGWMLDGFIVTFLLIMIFSALDFWTVKNVSGRLLVGLRWRNYVDEEGNSHWKFESKKTKTDQNALETQIFWFVLIIFPLLWTIFSLVAFLTLKWTWLVVVLFAAVMTGSNLYGYLRCKWHSRQEIRSYISQNLFWKMLNRSQAEESGTASVDG